MATKFDEFTIVIGDDCMALYANEELVTAATRLSFGDILEGCGLTCDIIECDLSINEPEKFPKSLKQVPFEMEA